MKRARFERARAVVAADYVKVTGEDSQGRPVRFMVPCGRRSLASHGVEIKFSQVDDHWTIHVGCVEETSEGRSPCLGNKVTACYHGLAAFIYRQQVLGNEVRFCETKDQAMRLARMGGLAMHLIGRENGADNGLWTVVRPKRKGD